jgi:transposase
MMIGRQATKRECFVSISLEEYVAQDHLLRVVDWFLDLSEFRQSLAGSYSHTGRPSIDPELMIRGHSGTGHSGTDHEYLREYSRIII